MLRLSRSRIAVLDALEVDHDPVERAPENQVGIEGQGQGRSRAPHQPEAQDVGQGDDGAATLIGQAAREIRVGIEVDSTVEGELDPAAVRESQVQPLGQRPVEERRVCAHRPGPGTQRGGPAHQRGQRVLELDRPANHLKPRAQAQLGQQLHGQRSD